MADLVDAGTDLHVVLSRLENDQDKLTFLDNLFQKITQHQNVDPNLRNILSQTVSLYAPLLEKSEQIQKAALVFETGGYYTQAIVDYLHVKAYGDAARCAELAGNMAKAVEYYIKGQLWVKAAESADKLGDAKTAHDLYKSAIDQFVALKEFRQAALAAERAGMMKESLELSAQQIDQVGSTDSKYLYEELVERALQSQFFDLAIELAIRGELFQKAIEIAESHDAIDKIPAVYRKYLDTLYPKERVPVFHNYVRFLAEHGSQSVAKTAYVQEVRFLKEQEEYLVAAELAEEAKIPEATDLYRLAMIKSEKHADFAKAALAATKLGLVKEADFYRGMASIVG